MKLEGVTLTYFNLPYTHRGITATMKFGMRWFSVIQFRDYLPHVAEVTGAVSR